MAKKIAMIFGLVFIVVGIVGFFNNPIINIFQAGTIHSIVHLLAGLVLFFASRSSNPQTSGTALKIVGIVYGLVTVLGFLMIGDKESVTLLGLVDVNHADNWLHLVLSALMIWAGFSAPKTMMSSSASGGMM
jgi:hypothetical protein